jgi:ABC-type molybdate transport system substrate-binding protein
MIDAWEGPDGLLQEATEGVHPVMTRSARRTRRTLQAAGAGAAALLALTACSSSDSHDTKSAPAPSESAKLSGTVTVFAAAAQAFIQLVKSAEGQKVLSGAGFLKP